jgi:hypothetical protein
MVRLCNLDLPWDINDCETMCADIGLALVDSSEALAPSKDPVEASEGSNDSVDDANIWRV